MSKDDKRRRRLISAWKYVRQQGPKAGAWTIGSLFKAVGIIGILCGLMTIALANMDIDPKSSLIWGTLVTALGLLLLYFGHKIAAKARKT